MLFSDSLHSHLSLAGIPNSEIVESIFTFGEKLLYIDSFFTGIFQDLSRCGEYLVNHRYARSKTILVMSNQLVDSGL